MHEFEHYTVVVEGYVSPSDSARFAGELRLLYRDRHSNGVDRISLETVALKILAGMGYKSAKVCYVEKIDYTGFNISP